VTPGPRWANRESLPGDGLCDVCALLGAGGTSSGAVPRCDGYRDALGRNARVTARRVRDLRTVTRALQRHRAQPICEVPPLVAVRAQPLWDAASGAVMRHM